MSLSARLDAAPPPNRGIPCPIAVILEQLSDEDRVSLIAHMEIGMGKKGRITTTAITQALNDEGFSIHYKSVERHRRQMCRCFKGTRA